MGTVYLLNPYPPTYYHFNPQSFQLIFRSQRGREKVLPVAPTQTKHSNNWALGVFITWVGARNAVVDELVERKFYLYPLPYMYQLVPCHGFTLIYFQLKNYKKLAVEVYVCSAKIDGNFTNHSLVLRVTVTTILFDAGVWFRIGLGTNQSMHCVHMKKRL